MLLIKVILVFKALLDVEQLLSDDLDLEELGAHGFQLRDCHGLEQLLRQLLAKSWTFNLTDQVDLC